MQDQGSGLRRLTAGRPGCTQENSNRAARDSGAGIPGPHFKVMWTFLVSTNARQNCCCWQRNQGPKTDRDQRERQVLETEVIARMFLSRTLLESRMRLESCGSGGSLSRFLLVWCPQHFYCLIANFRYNGDKIETYQQKHGMC